MKRLAIRAAFLLSSVQFISCSGESPQPGASHSSVPSGTRTAVLLVTLDTTRADSIGPDAAGIETTSFNEIAARGALFVRAYAAAPETLPAHTSMMSGLYPAGHGVHENARAVSRSTPLLAEQLREKGYRTAAFVSAYPLDGQFGLSRGFDLYDDELGDGKSERSSDATTQRAIQWIRSQNAVNPVFIWVHYFDPHYPYSPAEPFVSRHADHPYLGEVAAMDEQLGRLVTTYHDKFGSDAAVIVAGDHGESLGEHGEAQHGNLLYEGAMRVPLAITGPGVEPARVTRPVSTRRIFHTVLAWAGTETGLSLFEESNEVVLGEAMRPFLSFGWQPQVMAVDADLKVIRAGSIEAYDVVRDPQERKDISASAQISRGIRQGLNDYPIPAIDASTGSESLSEEDRRQLASLGYVGSDVAPVVRPDAPRPADMTHLFDELDRASGLFVAGDYAGAIPVLESIIDEDPGNLMAILRLAVARFETGDRGGASEAFRRARELAPQSIDVKHYLAMYHLAGGELDRAASLLEEVLASAPQRTSSIEALASVRERQRRLAEAFELRQKLSTLRKPEASELQRLALLAMAVGNTPAAIDSFEKLRSAEGSSFAHHLELGVLYMDARRLHDSRAALDRVPPRHPQYPMALFKRAQVSVLLGEPDSASRIAAARANANTVTRPLIERERLFRESQFLGEAVPR